ncbi:hypothetical protein [Helcococcus bovis]|uniref:hypothetical protein n=1 Tax=Helcococcus bovis TaxID=3153252 RepID=UPI0038BB100E
MFFYLFGRKSLIEKIKIADLLLSLGGKENILDHEICTSRVRLQILNPFKLDENMLKKCNLPGYSIPEENKIHLIIGPDVEKFYEKLKTYI